LVGGNPPVGATSHRPLAPQFVLDVCGSMHDPLQAISSAVPDGFSGQMQLLPAHAEPASVWVQFVPLLPALGNPGVVLTPSAPHPPPTPP
jgi:hypothetical protein